MKQKRNYDIFSEFLKKNKQYYDTVEIKEFSEPELQTPKNDQYLKDLETLK